MKQPKEREQLLQDTKKAMHVLERGGFSIAIRNAKTHIGGFRAKGTHSTGGALDFLLTRMDAHYLPEADLRGHHANY